MTVKPPTENFNVLFVQNVATIFRRTAKVVVFMPPAVEPGDPPISISSLQPCHGTQQIIIYFLFNLPAIPYRFLSLELNQLKNKNIDYLALGR